MNRLVDRGLLARTPGQAARGPTGKITYSAVLSEDEYLMETIERTLEGASPEARHVAISQLIGRLEKPRRKGKKGKS